MIDKGIMEEGFSANTLKIIAIVAMLIDHVAWAFVPTVSILGVIMHLIGRLTAPIMCFFIAEGYHHTKNLKKYTLRLGIFAIISYIPFIFYETGKLPTAGSFLHLNVIYTLMVGLLALWVQDTIKSKWVRMILICTLCILALPGDWLFFAVFFILSFGINSGNIKKQIYWFSISSICMIAFVALPYIILFANYGSLQAVTNIQITPPLPTVWEFTSMIVMQMGVFLSLPLLFRYNGQRGGGKYSKWIFYIFYPVHLILLGLIKLMILN